MDLKLIEELLLELKDFRKSIGQSQNMVREILSPSIYRKFALLGILFFSVPFCIWHFVCIYMQPVPIYVNILFYSFVALTVCAFQIAKILLVKKIFLKNELDFNFIKIMKLILGGIGFHLYLIPMIVLVICSIIFLILGLEVWIIPISGIFVAFVEINIGALMELFEYKVMGYSMLSLSFVVFFTTSNAPFLSVTFLYTVPLIFFLFATYVHQKKVHTVNDNE